ncbi:transmembrane protein 255B isoform X3 [Mustela putorius furo]|uniref:Transmembrane protein 255B isoform X3 n=1 Tax=Mustela putorius furo TaxID=9669 RepID=A0A8U0V398_MUSPF|nr:transmembrane protein 255B isoform X3 [Mustela putorius furo]
MQPLAPGPLALLDTTEGFARRKKDALWSVGSLLVVSAAILTVGLAATTRTENVTMGGYYPGIILGFGAFLGITGLNLVENRKQMLVAAIVFVSFGVVAAFCCALVDGVFVARHIVSLPPFALRGCRGSDTPAESQPRPRALWRLPPRPADAGSPANVFPRSLQSGPSTRVHVPVREHMRAHTHAHDSQAHTVHHALVCFPHTRARTHTHTHAHVRTQTQAHTHLCAVHAHTAHAYVYTGTLTCYCASVHSGTHSRTHAHVRVSTLTHACVQTPWRTRVHTRALTGLGISAGVPVCSSQL